MTAVDVHVGGRVRLRRTMLGMSQQRLGQRLGVTFQQVQKYENESNRIGAGRLQKLSEVLGVQVQFFYDGMSEGPTGDDTSDHSQRGLGQWASECLSSREGLELNRAFLRVSDAEIRKAVVKLVRALAQMSEEE